MFSTKGFAKVADAQLILNTKVVQLTVLRLDALHPVTGGNKHFKLKYNLEHAQQLKKNTLLTFGGAWSNHIAATALAGMQNGFKTIGVIRGEEEKELNKTLAFADQCGMQLYFVTREQYRKKEEPDFLLCLPLLEPTKNIYVIPEGGSNELGFKGCMEIVKNAPRFDVVVCPVGTGTTLAGITASLTAGQTALGIAVLTGEGYLEKETERYLPEVQRHRFSINHHYTFGGYAKTNIALQQFTANFVQQQGLLIEPIYTGKMFFGIFDLIQKGFFKQGTRVLSIHTGGLQYL